jgi:hypothetical protein
MGFTSAKVSREKLRHHLQASRKSIAMVAREMSDTAPISAGTITNWMRRGEVIGVRTEYLEPLAKALDVPVEMLTPDYDRVAITVSKDTYRLLKIKAGSRTVEKFLEDVSQVAHLNIKSGGPSPTPEEKESAASRGRDKSAPRSQGRQSKRRRAG